MLKNGEGDCVLEVYEDDDDADVDDDEEGPKSKYVKIESI
jgi:hypothetical protein